MRSLGEFLFVTGGEQRLPQRVGSHRLEGEQLSGRESPDDLSGLIEDDDVVERI